LGAGHEEGAASARAKIDEWREIAQKAQAALLTFEDALGVRLGEGLAATGLGLRQRWQLPPWRVVQNPSRKATSSASSPRP
jgi:hypothetical protein